MSTEFVVGVVCALAVNISTYVMYWYDKGLARENARLSRLRRRRRVSEAFLLFLGLIGGWPAAWLAIYSLRHKTSWRKRWFRFTLAAASAANVVWGLLVLYCRSV